jgi:hypothetical protein
MQKRAFRFLGEACDVGVQRGEDAAFSGKGSLSSGVGQVFKAPIHLIGQGVLRLSVQGPHKPR